MGTSSRITKIAFGFIGASAAVGAALMAACSSDPPKSTAGGGTTGLKCAISAGEIPASDCDDSTNECTGTGCKIDEAKCGSASTCLPMADNKGKSVWDLRLRKLNVVAPSVLAEFFIQNLVVGRNVDLEAPQCGDKGTGSFSWLIRIDKAQNKLITGGAPPSADPFGLGFCFAKGTSGGIPFGPATIDITFDGNKVAPIGTIPKLNVPIYVNGDINNVVLLPIQNGNIHDVTISEDGNCIGDFDSKALNSDCDELRGACTKWKTAGALGGFIALEEADKIVLNDLENRTLCGFLTGNTKEKGCARDASGKLTAKGDYCSQTNAPGGCGDAYWLAATFAAAAVKIHDGASISACSGGGAPSTDAGAD